MKSFLLLTIVAISLWPQVNGQADGNPHGWDRKRRCDADYEEPCGVCEGYGGIATGDRNDDITLTTCEPVGSADEVTPGPRPVWGTRWHLPVAYEVLIGKKMDPFCFQTFPGNDSVGDLCYRYQEGSKDYDMLDARAVREDLDIETIVGNVAATILHQGPNMWIVNHFPWWTFGIYQCVCVPIREGGAGRDPVYPIQYNWVDKLNYVGREILGIEYIDVTAELDHWVYGPHHVWTYPESGQIIRMWQPFNGLQIYPEGVGQGDVDEGLFSQIPPSRCIKGSEDEAAFRTGCADDGYPLPPEDKNKPMKRPSAEEIKVSLEDHKRAITKKPRDHYKGVDFQDMSAVLNGWLNSTDGLNVKACELWKVEELQQLQALLYLARQSHFDGVYQSTMDNRRLRHHVLQDLDQHWKGLNSLADNLDNPLAKTIHRDGHCHEAVMWYVHHLTEDLKEILTKAGVSIPMLSHVPHHMSCSAFDMEDDESMQRICKSYKDKVTCADCHSNVLP